MTAPRRELNPIRQILAVLAAFAVLSGPAPAGTSEWIVTDRYSGLAIGGFDPVAYFTDQTPRVGLEAFELEAGDAIWRFRNEGNRDSFRANREIYAPQFGGYDPTDIARGVSRAGQPQIWAIVDRQLYLFGDEANRDQFIADPRLRRTAVDRWPAVAALLAR